MADKFELNPMERAALNLEERRRNERRMRGMGIKQQPKPLPELPDDFYRRLRILLGTVPNLG